jgi:threonine dehydrogenase-like Zn-dependent dehydrogenase
MKAIALVPGTTEVSLVDINEPTINSPHDVKLKVWEVGICSTDREEVSGGRAETPKGERSLVIGHEMFGQVSETGSAVTKVKKGDYGVLMVRRGCGACEACRNGRSDMCYTGNYTERGIKAANGFQSEYVVDEEQYLVKVPADMKEIGVLTEPMSVASKAIDESLQIQQARLGSFSKNKNWLQGKKALVAGLGPIGLMAAFALRLRGAEVIGLDIVDEDSLRSVLLRQIGGQYIDGRKVQVVDIDATYGEADFIFEATGIANLQLQLIDALAVNGIYVATGIPGGNRPLNLPVGNLMKQLVLKNQVVLGSVNASIQHYQMAIEDLQASLQKWPSAIKAVITDRIPYTDFLKALKHPSEEEIKVVVDWK